MIQAVNNSPEQFRAVVSDAHGLLNESDLKDDGASMTNRLNQVLEATDNGLIAANQELDSYDLSTVVKDINGLANQMENAKTLEHRSRKTLTLLKTKPLMPRSWSL